MLRRGCGDGWEAPLWLPQGWALWEERTERWRALEYNPLGVSWGLRVAVRGFSIPINTLLRYLLSNKHYGSVRREHLHQVSVPQIIDRNRIKLFCHRVYGIMMISTVFGKLYWKKLNVLFFSAVLEFVKFLLYVLEQWEKESQDIAPLLIWDYNRKVEQRPMLVLFLPSLSRSSNSVVSWCSEVAKLLSLRQCGDLSFVLIGFMGYLSFLKNEINYRLKLFIIIWSSLQ